jgi:Protoglobin
MKKVAEQISGYSYGSPEVSASSVALRDLENLKITVGWTEEDERYRRLAGEVLAGQTKQLVDHWRGGIIEGIPNLIRHSRTPDGDPIPDYQAKSGLRFEQWILDTCLRPYDLDWLNYQQEIALRHTSQKKNRIDGVNSTPYVPLRDIIAFVPVMNETIKQYLAARGHAPEEVEKMHRAWCKSLQLQVAIWTKAYGGNEW